MTDLSILIPARNEMFLSKTVQDIFENIEGDTEVIVVLDGVKADPPLKPHPRLTTIYHSVPIGQRAATNEAAKISKAKYVVKTDAHCAFDKGFDVKMMKEMHDDWTMVPTMKNLHVFNWICPDYKKGVLNDKKEEAHCRYQGPSGPCEEMVDGKKCGKPTVRDIVWIPKKSPNSNFFRFDNSLHFQYWKGFEKRPEGQGQICETMSIQGSFFMCTREKYWQLDICDEAHGSWGQQGVEVACKTWLSGGKLMVNKKTWYAHMFRTQGGDFGFPYPNNEVEKAREYSRNLWKGNNWKKAIYDLDWLINKFGPVPDWDVSKGIIYYTDNELDPKIMAGCQRQLKRAVGQTRIVSVSLKPIGFGDNIHLPLKRGYLTMFKQILAGLEALKTDIVFFCEHDILYHPSHFAFIPSKNDVYYYNENVWKVRLKDGHALHYDCRQLSGLCANREFLIKHYKERIRRVEKEGFSRRMGFEPGTHNRPERVDDFKAEGWKSEGPNIDIRHDTNLTPSRWKKEEFRDQRYTKGWIESTIDKIPGWKNLKDIME